MAVEFSPIGALRALIKATRADLEHARAANAALVSSINKLDQKSLRPEVFRERVAELRSEAAAKIRQRLASEGTAERLANIAAQASFWTPRACFARALMGSGIATEIFDTSGNTAKLLQAVLGELKLTRVVSGLSRMSPEALAESADVALAQQNHQWLSAIYAEADGRLHSPTTPEADGTTLRTLRMHLEKPESVPELGEAQGLIREAKQLGEHLSYTERAIATGEADIGLRMETYASDTFRRGFVDGQSALDLLPPEARP